jgi:hypothetical protein
MAVFLLAWEGLVYWLDVPELYLPRPSVIAATLWKLFAEKNLGFDTALTLYRIFGGFFLAAEKRPDHGRDAEDDSPRAWSTADSVPGSVGHGRPHAPNKRRLRAAALPKILIPSTTTMAVDSCVPTPS